MAACQRRPTIAQPTPVQFTRPQKRLVGVIEDLFRDLLTAMNGRELQTIRSNPFKASEADPNSGLWYRSRQRVGI